MRISATMKCCTIALLLAATVTFGFPQEIQRLDPAVDRIIPANAKLERVATGFDKWTEGPVWSRDGRLFFAEIPANNIDVWVPGKGAHVFIHPSGYTGSQPYKGPEPGSNGMTLDSKGRLTMSSIVPTVRSTSLIRLMGCRLSRTTTR
jgi:gluconolactonase